MEKKHNFTHAISERNGNGWIVVYCTECGLVSFDQSKQGINGEYQKIARKVGKENLTGSFTKHEPNYFSVWEYKRNGE